MTKYWGMNRTKLWRGVAACLLGVALAASSCTKVDNELGNSLIPDDQRMKICKDTLEGIGTQVIQTIDSFGTSKLEYGCIGSAVDPIFGRTSSSFCAQFMMSYFTTGSEMFGYAPVFDSLQFVFTYNASYLGDTTKTQKFNVYELDKNIYYDSSYYATFDPSKVAGSTKLFSFEVTGVPTDEITMTLKTPEAIAYGKRLMDTTGGSYSGDSLFYKRFKGLYFVPDAASPKNACVYRIAFSSMELALHAHNFTDATAKTPKDTLTVYYSFDNAYYYNGRAQSIRHDYTGTPIEGHINDTLSTDATLSYGYVQTLGGVASYVQFTEDFVKRLKALVVSPYKSMIINKATIQWPLADPTTIHLNEAPTRLGAYSDYYHFTNILDYDYTYETSQNGTLMFDGYLNRTSCQYATDLSSFIQSLVSDADAPRHFVLGPGVDLMSNFMQAQLSTGAATPPLRVALVYTLIR